MYSPRYTFPYGGCPECVPVSPVVHDTRRPIRVIELAPVGTHSAVGNIFRAALTAGTSSLSTTGHFLEDYQNIYRLERAL